MSLQPTTPRLHPMPLVASALAIVMVAAAAVVGITTPAHAIEATGGLSPFAGTVQWFSWGASGQQIPNSGITKTETFVSGGQAVSITCSLSDIHYDGRPPLTESALASYRPGQWGGDAFDDLYNRGGTGGANQLVVGLANRLDGRAPKFDFTCSASSNGSPLPLDGLVFADAEQSGGGEYIAATPTSAATWRIIDKYQTPGCTARSTATLSAGNRLTLGNLDGVGCPSGPATVAFLDGASSATDVTVKGGGTSAIALGVVVTFDRGDAPASYGDPLHGLQIGWTGGTLAPGAQLIDDAFPLAVAGQPGLRLGARVDSDDTALFSAQADGDDRDSFDDEDSLALPSISRVPGTRIALTPSCASTGYVAGWIDFTHDGDFLDAGERSITTRCSGGSASLLWTVPPTAVTSTGAGHTFLRLRTSATSAEIATPSSFSSAGEVEDHPFDLVVLHPIAAPDRAVTQQNTPVVIAPAENDALADGTTDVVASTLRLIDATGALVTSLSVPGGTFSVDTSTGAVTFVPSAGFRGPVPQVRYAVFNAGGQRLESTIDVTVTAVVPVARPDLPTTTQGAALTVDVVGNDSAGNAGTPLVPTQTRLVVGGATVTSQTIPGEGVYEVLPSGAVRFVPEPGFVGTSTAVYRIVDVDGGSADSTLTVSVAGVAPRAADDAGFTGQNTPVTVDVLGNDLPGVAGGTPLDPASLRLIGPGGPTTSPVVTPAGTFSIVAGGVRFVPAPGFTGAVPPIGYQVADVRGATSTASLAITVAAVAPHANPDAATTQQGARVAIDVLGNDLPGNEATPLETATLRLVDPRDGSRVTTLTRPEGTYTVAAGQVLFTPVPSFVGTPSAPIGYAVADVDGTETTSTLQPRVVAVPLRAHPDSAQTGQNLPVQIDVASNDDPGIVGGGAPVPSSVRLLDPTGAPVTSLRLAEGVFEVDTATGIVTFTPATDHRGEVPPVPYRIADVNGEVATSTIDVVVEPARPRAFDDAIATPQGNAVTLAPAANDNFGNASTPLDPSTIQLVDPGAAGTISADRRTVTIAGQGSYAVQPDGATVFTPLPAFTGAATPVGYEIRDRAGNVTSAELRVTVTPLAPVAVGDAARTQQNVPITGIDVQADDGPAIAGGTPLVRSLLAFAGGATSLRNTAGVFTVVDGMVDFAPNAGFSGAAPPVDYVVTDANGLTATAQLRVVVDPVRPTAVDDVTSTLQATPVTIEPLANDAAGNAATPIDPATLRLQLPPGVPASAVSADGRRLTVPGEGTYAFDASAGRLTFTPLPAFSGAATPVDYTVDDADGASTRAAVRVAVTPVAPITAADGAWGQQNQPAEVRPLDNDRAGDGSTLDPSTLTLLDDSGAPVDIVVVAGVGQFALDGVTVTFTPASGWTGTTPPVRYRVAADNGAEAQSTLAVTLMPVAPTAAPDAMAGTQNTPVTIDPLANDLGGNPQTPLVRSSVRLVDPATSAPVTRVVIAGEGEWTVDTATGQVRFAPAPGFSGTTTPLGYTVDDIDGATAASTVVAQIAGVQPTAVNDAPQTRQGVAVTFSPTANDTAGNAATPLVPGSLRLGDPGVPGAVLEPSGLSLTVPGEGRYTVDPATGAVRFVPVTDFAGVANAVPYTIRDADGGAATSFISVNVAPAGLVAVDDSVSGTAGRPVLVNPLANDASGGTLDPTSVRLVASAGGAGAVVSADGRTLQMPGEGTYTVDPVTGTVTFVSALGFTGVATPITYSVADMNGVRVSAAITIRIAAAPGLGGIALTGSEPWLGLGVAAALLLLGAATLLLGRRRAA